MDIDDSDLQLLEDDVRRLHDVLENGNLAGLENTHDGVRDADSLLTELNKLMSDEVGVLTSRINNEIEAVERAREDLKSDISTEKREVELANSVRDEWEELMEWKEKQKDNDKEVVIVDRNDNPVPQIKEIKNRLKEILKLEQEELEDITGSSSSEGIKGFIEDDLNQITETHQRIALFREALVQISRETYAVEGDRFGMDYDLATELGTSDLDDVQQNWVRAERHVEKIEKTKLPGILEKEKQLIEELEQVFEELETLVDLDKDLLNDITGQSSEGGFFIGFGSGDLYDVLNREEVRPDGTVVSDHDNVDPILPEAVEQLNNISDIIDEIKREGIGEGKQLDELMSETEEFIQEEKRKVESELNRLEQVDTSDAELGDVPIGDYPPQIRQKADELKKIIVELRNAEKGSHRDIGDVEDEFQDLKERARRVHSMEDEEIEDLREFDKRAEKIRLMFVGDREGDDNIEGVITAFEKYADRHDDISKVFDLPTDEQINKGFPDKTFEQLPGHIQGKIKANDSKQNLNPNNFMTENDLLLAPESSFIDFGLEQIQNSVQSLETDIERIYSEQEKVEDTFESLENELNDIRDKFERIEGRYSDYIELKEELSNTTVQTQEGVRNDVTAEIEEAAALMAYDVEAPRQAKEKLQEDLGDGGNVSSWIETQIPAMMNEIEEIIYDSDDSIVNEEHVKEEEIEDAIKNITQSIEMLKREFDDDSAATGVPKQIQEVVDGILESLASIAEKCTDFEEEEDRVQEELRRWAAPYDDLIARSEKYSESLGRGDRRSTKEPSNDIDYDIDKEDT